MIFFSVPASPARQRARSPKGRDGAPPPSHICGNAAFVSKNGASVPETWDPYGAASLPFSSPKVLPHGPLKT